MPYYLQARQLRVVEKYTRQERNRSVLANTRVIILEHILPTTEEFLAHLQEAGAEVSAVVAKPYSIDRDVMAKLKERGLAIREHSYEQMESTPVLDDILNQAVAESMADHKHILILEVGGYFADPLTRMPPEAAQFIAGVVEDTTFGHNRYLKQIDKVPVPVFSVARSPLKEIEARFVGRDAAASVEHVLRKMGVAMAGRRALVIGYGMIGSNVARALRAFDMEVQVYDRRDDRNLAAFIDGFRIGRKRSLINAADIIFAATAERALTIEEIEECKDNVILASVGSKDTEFDVASLQMQASESSALLPEMTRYQLSDLKRVVVLANGTAVNFLLPSLPVEILDLVFAEMLVCGLTLLKRQPDYTPGQLYDSQDKVEPIAHDWLRSVNML
jgi:adenosylhomocysteinase